MAENPYSAPAVFDTQVPDAPPSHGWEIEKGFIVAQNGALFPMIDPYTGGSEERMTMHQLTIRKIPFWVLIPAYVIVAILIIMVFTQSGEFMLTWITWFGIAVGAAALLQPSISFRVFLGKSSIRRIRWDSLSSIALMIFTISVFAIQSFESIDLIENILLFAIGLGVLLKIGIGFTRRNLKCRRKSGPHFELRGFHPDAVLGLEKLTPRAIQAARSSPSGANSARTAE